MKTFITSIAFLFLILFSLSAQNATKSVFEPSLKFGKPSEDELKMTTYAQDSSAAAVVLYSISDARYEYNANEFQLVYYNEVKIKVLKSEGTSYANINIPYYENDENRNTKEFVSQINAASYNMEGGKMVRTKMNSDLIFKERANQKYMQIKFSIPNVKVGTVFEYKYKLTSDFYYNLNNWEAQKDIPVIYAKHQVLIPEYFVFNLEMRGRERLAADDKSEGQMFSVSSSGGQRETVNCTARCLTFVGNNLPALHVDKFIWCADDYRSGVNFELKGLNFPGAPFKTFTMKWSEIDDMLLKDDSFGKQNKMKNPFREEMGALGLDKLNTVEDKVGAIFTFLKKKISWNQRYEIYSEDIKKAIKNGNGSNADINFLLMSMLRELNINCYPAVMSRKTMGILPITHPSLQKLNTFVVAVANTDSTYLFIDGSVNNGYFNVLPPVLMVERARIIGLNKEDNWVDLTRIGRNQIRGAVNAKITPDGLISGMRLTKYVGQFAADMREQFKESKDSTEYVQKLETSENIKVKEFKLEELNLFSPQVKESLNFEKQVTVNDNLMYINPLVFLHKSKSPFLQSERHLPIEMPYVEDYALTITLELPEGYVIDELPKATYIKAEDGQGICKYNIVSDGAKVTLKYNFNSNKLLFLPTEYPSVKAFWEAIVQKNNEMLVIKKS